MAKKNILPKKDRSALRAKVQYLNKIGNAAVKGATDCEEKLAAYKKYVDRCEYTICTY